MREKFRMRRLKRRLTLMQVYLATGIGNGRLSMFERGIINLKPEELERLKVFLFTAQSKESNTLK
jgi:hypothetical protein